jgi:cation diffusion facilitator CzcD-associated flavoprotein CzcO
MRKVLEIDVGNETALMEIQQFKGCLPAEIETAAGERRPNIYAKIVLPMGHAETGCWWMPDSIGTLPKHLQAHAADNVDFSSLAGKIVVVLRAGVSAFDNAAEASDTGANPAHLFGRRAGLQTI